MTVVPPRPAINRWLEPLFAIAVLAGLGYAMWFLGQFGYLPPPFFYETNDTWMDWFNTSFWAHAGGAYDNWQTIYPPLSSATVLLLSNPVCYPDLDVLAVRDCDWVGIATLHGFFILNIFLIGRTYLKIDRSTAWPRSVAIAAGLPMCYTLDRGNLLIIVYTCVLLAHGPLLRSARWKWIAAGLSVNFKVYLIAMLFPQLIRRRWRWFEGAAIATILIYLASYLMIGAGSPQEIYYNIIYLNVTFKADSLLDGWYATTYRPLIALLEGDLVPVSAIIGSSNVDTLLLFLPLAQHITQAAILLAMIGAWLRPEVVPMFRLTNLAMALALITVEAGGYALSLCLLFVMMEKWRGVGAKIAIVVTYVLCIPIDFEISELTSQTRDSFFAGGPIIQDFVLSVGPFIRPLLFMIVPFALSCTTVRAVWIDVRAQGDTWRWRYRNDLKLLPGGVAQPPARSPRS